MAASRKVTSEAVSHLPIPPPEWCRLPKDKDLPRIFFHAGKDLPTTFLLDDSSRCSCGEIESFEEVTTTSLIIYTSVFAVEKQIETRYCPTCRNTRGRIGPDLGEHGILNWNNKIAFSHELMNAFTSCFTTSETPAYSSIGKRADPNSVRPGTRPIGRYTGRVSGWECCHPLRIGHSSGGLRWRQNPTRVKLLKVGRVTVGGRVTQCNRRIVK